jgi:uncharacterized protein (DUF983 family)
MGKVEMSEETKQQTVNKAYIAIECPKCGGNLFYTIVVRENMILKCEKCLHELDGDGHMVPIIIGVK